MKVLLSHEEQSGANNYIDRTGFSPEHEEQSGANRQVLPEHEDQGSAKMIKRNLNCLVILYAVVPHSVAKLANGYEFCSVANFVYSLIHT